MKKGKAKETDEAEKSRAVNVKEAIDVIAESGVELAIEVGHYLYFHVLFNSIIIYVPLCIILLF